MPLVRAAPIVADAAPPESGAALRAQLDAADPGARRHAARGLAGDRDAAPALAARLDREPEEAVREALFGSLLEIGGAEVAALIAPLLRAEDAALRGGAIEALKGLGDAAVPAVDGLLGDPDPDVRLLAIEVARGWPGALAIPRLRRIFESDVHVNVCGAAVDVATEVGTAELLPALERLRTRFPAEPFLLFAVGVASARISAGGGRGA